MFYHDANKWYIALFLVMPDHWHAIMGFGGHSKMTESIRSWKRYTSRQLEIEWQDGFFEHRLRNENEEREKFLYIKRNPVVLA